MAKTQSLYGQPANYNATPPTLTDGDPSGLEVDNHGNLKVTVTSPGGTSVQYTDGDAAAAHPVGTGIIFDDAGTYTFVSDTSPLPVTATFSPSGTQDVNLTKVGGAAFALGQSLAAASVPVVLTAAQISTLTPLSSVAVTQSTSPWIVAGGGTAGSAASGVVTVQGIASMTPVQVSQATASNLNATVSQATGTNLHTVVDSGTITTVSTVTTVSTLTTLSQFAGNAINLGNGTVGTGTLRVTLASDSTGNIATIGTSVTPGTAATNLGKAEDAVHASSDTGVFALGVSNEAQSTMNADGDYSIQATDTKGNRMVVGNIAHNTADAGNPVKVGQKAIAFGANPTGVSANARTDWYSTRAGVPFIIAGHPNIITIRANYTSAQTDTAIVTISTGSKIVVTRCSVLADNANSVDVAARIGFGTASTPTTTGTILSHPGIAAGSGVIEGTASGILGVGADNEDLRITSEVPTGGSIDVVVSYFTIES